MFQSTRPHGARRSGFSVFRVYHAVSIHAPARGATIRIFCLSRVPCGFNPRARTGRDRLLYTKLEYRRCFNPRARTGRDRAGLQWPASLQLFQSTRPHGARHTPPELPPEGSDVSIHAPARGATPRLESAPAIGFCFNPRARTGRDTIAELNKRGWDVSIHAPARGATNLFSTIAAIT